MRVRVKPHREQVKQRAKLPKLTLPKFREVTKWNTFWDSFQSAIHDNPDISKVDKFNYLNSVLEGPAVRAIARLTLTVHRQPKLASLADLAIESV